MGGSLLNLVQTTQSSERCLQVEKEDGDNQNSLEGTGSIVSNLSENCGTGVGCFSRLGCGARRQLAIILDDFWEQLFDFHGNASQKAKANKIDILFGEQNSKLNVGASVFVPSDQRGYVHGIRTQNPAVSRNSWLNSEQSYYDHGPYSSRFVHKYVNPMAFNHSLPRISGLALPRQGAYGGAEKIPPWDSYGQSFISDSGSMAGFSSVYNDQVFLSNPWIEGYSGQLYSELKTNSLWSPRPSQRLFGTTGIPRSTEDGGLGSKSNSVTKKTNSHSELEAVLLQYFRRCMRRLLKLEGSEWLFSQLGGADEDLIDLVAARERYHCVAESGQVTHRNETSEIPRQYLSTDSKFGSGLKNDETSFTVPNCGENCVWKKDLVVSFGVWCIRRILEFSLVESRPELWGMYTYVLNRLQGILEPAFSKSRTLMTPCLCLQITETRASKLSPPLDGGGVSPPAAKSGMGKCTNASAVIDIVNYVKFVVSSRKGRSGTTAGNVAFPKGKENLVPVLKRYRRRLSNMKEEEVSGFANHESTPRVWY